MYDDVRPQPLVAQLGQRPGERRADESRPARDLRGELREALLRHRVAIDPDQQPVRSEALGDEPRVAAAPTVQSTATSPARGSTSSTSSPARTGTWVDMSSRMAEPRGDPGDVVG
jgi:hypothetical protein